MAELSIGEFYSQPSPSAASVQEIFNNTINTRNYISDQQRRDCIKELLHEAKGVKLQRGMQQQLAQKYGVSRWTVGRLWKSVQNHLNHKQQLKASKNYKGKVGRKSISISDQTIMELPLRKRCNIRSMANALNTSKSSLHRLVKSGKIRRHSSTLKPALTVKNKIQRLRFCLQQLQTATVNNQPTFKDMYNCIHVDEKWFFMSKTSQNFYLAPTEMEACRSTKHKSHICKVMFLVAVTRPWFGEDGEEIYDGKICCLPLTEVVPAKRSSRHRAKGTLETKPIKTINQEVIKHVFISKLLPAIKSRWPLVGDGNILIQQDNATPHILNEDPDFQSMANADGFNITLVSQPPNSPDFNVLDLGFFRAIQSIQHQQMPSTIDELVNAVNYAYWSYDSKLLDKVFLSYQYVMREVMKVGGGNNYKLPHAAKHRLEREGRLPRTVEVQTEVVLQAVKALIDEYGQLQANSEDVFQPQEDAEDNDNSEYLCIEEVAQMEVDAIQSDMGNLTIN